MDEAWRWLKENDPEFKQRERLKNPYLSNRQLKFRKLREVSLSSIGVFEMEVDGEQANIARSLIS